MQEYVLNIGGSEWIIIIFAALILILGAGKMPGTARKIGKAVNEYNKAKKGIQEHIEDAPGKIQEITGPVGTEREKLETMAKSAGASVDGKTDDELRKIIAEKVGGGNNNSSSSGGGDTS